MWLCVCVPSLLSGQPQSWPSLALIRLGAIIPALPYKCTGGIKWPQRPACHRDWALVCRLSGSRETHRIHCYSYHLHTVFYGAFFTSLHTLIFFFKPPPSPCLWCQTGVITGQGKSLFFSLFLSVRQKTKQHGPKRSAVWPTGKDVRSMRVCECVCVCVSRLQGKVVQRKVNPSLTVMQIDEWTQHRVVATAHTLTHCKQNLTLKTWILLCLSIQ